MLRIIGSLLVLSLGVVGTPVLASDDEIHVFYPRAECLGDEIELEVWDRANGLWRKHPEHPRVPVESCQRETASILLQEIRWRCHEPDAPGFAAWHEGLDVFDPAITQSCEVGPLSSTEATPQIHIASPYEGAVVQRKKSYALIDGSVRVDGVEGVQYELVIALDRSGEGPEAARRLDAQILAARSLVSRLSPRLGDLRIGVVAFPGTKSGARVMTLPTASLRTLDRALQATRKLGTSGVDGFRSGLALALDLVAPSDGERVRPRARPVVVIAGDGTRAPFGNAFELPSYPVRIGELAERARKAGVRVHAFALAGHAENFSGMASELASKTRGSVRRVPVGAFDNDFFGGVKLPLPKLVTVFNPRTEHTARARLSEDGRFRAAVKLAPGENPLQITARTTSHTQSERTWRVSFDGSAAKELLLEAERDRMQRIRTRKELEISVGDEARGSLPGSPRR